MPSNAPPVPSEAWNEHLHEIFPWFTELGKDELRVPTCTGVRVITANEKSYPLHYEDLIRRGVGLAIERLLGRLFPHLKFQVFLRLNPSPTNALLHIGCWTRRKTAVMCFDAITTDVLDQLAAIDAEAAKEDDAHFFCSHCHRTHPNDRRAGFFHAARRCQDCATPEWRERVASESYD